MATVLALVSIPLLTAAVCWFTTWAEKNVVTGEPLHLPRLRLRHR